MHSTIINRYPPSVTTIAKATAAAEAINAIGEDVATVIPVSDTMAMVKVEDEDGNEIYL